MRFLVVVCLSFMLMFADHKIEKFKTLRMHLSMFVYPIQKIVDFPIASYCFLQDYFRTRKALLDENNNLQIEQLFLKSKLQKFLELESENVKLRELLKAEVASKEDFFAAKILRVDPNPLLHQVILNKGQEQGVYVGQPVIDANGIMGSVIEVNDFVSRVMLLTDPNHAIPVENVRNGVRAIAIGTGVNEQLALKHVTSTVDLSVGDTLVTSGLDGHYPSGYPVGVIVNIENDTSKTFSSIYVKPAAQLNRNRDVLLIKMRK